jgi:hypothetical protein
MFAQQHSQHRNRGQSLIETALFMPILLILLAGVVEVSNFLVTQNRVSTAARVATGYGASNFIGEEWNDPSVWAIGIADTAKESVTNTLDLAPELWDIWAIKGTLNPDSTGFVQWDAQHAHVGNVFSDAQWAAMESKIQSDVLDALDPSEHGLEIVATVAFHHRASILGLNALNFGPLKRIRGLSVMRVDPVAEYERCDAFPIAVSLNNRSLWPHGTDPIPEGDEEFPFESGNNYGGNSYHWFGRDDGVPYPIYEVGNTAQYKFNTPGTPLISAKPGDLFLTKQSTESGGGGFGWLRWDQSQGSTTPILTNSLTWPGNADTYYYPPPELFSDDGLDQFDIVAIHTGAVSAAKDVMETHIDTAGRMLKLIVFTPPDVDGGDANGDGYGTILNGGQNDRYEIYGFVIVRLVAWYLPGEHNWLLFEFVRFDRSCP